MTKTKFKLEDLPKPIQTRLTKLAKVLTLEDFLDDPESVTDMLDFAIDWIKSQEKLLRRVYKDLSENGYPLGD